MKKQLAANKKARHDYDILENFEAGIVLKGYEVKSIRQGQINIKEAYVRPIGGEIWLVGANISQYKQHSDRTYDPTRSRKLLFSRREISKMIGRVQEKGLTLLPLSVYLVNNKLVKLEIGLGRGRKLYDKRQVIKKREQERELRRRFNR
jgi:SsrA-binding protein